MIVLLEASQGGPMPTDTTVLRRPGPGDTTITGRVAGKVVLITGAARGQGAAEARALAAEGATVVATDIVAADEIAPGELDGHGDAIVYRRLDVTVPAAWARLAAELKARFGQVHGLVNNAGCTHLAGLLDVQLADWERVLRVNTTGPLLGIQTLAPLMSAGASIVTIGSAAALTPNFTAAYTASKWAVRGLAKVASVELGPLGIRSNLIHPGYIETPMVTDAPPAFRQAQLAANPLGILGQPEDVAHLVVYLISDESRYLSGAEIAVDGGFTGQAGAKTLFDAVRALDGSSGVGAVAAQ
jgi:3alpha(or 20beta)-hydroxysteroid dehydrogenase